MDVNYFILTALHVIGTLLNLRFLVSCLKNKEKYTILRKRRLLMIFQSFTQLVFLEMNSEEAMKAFSNESRQNTFNYMYLCNVGSGLLISYGSLLNFQFILLGMICARYRSNLFTKRGYFSCKVAVLASFMTAIVTTFGIIFCLVRVDFFPMVKPLMFSREPQLLHACFY